MCKFYLSININEKVDSDENRRKSNKPFNMIGIKLTRYTSCKITTHQRTDQNNATCAPVNGTIRNKNHDSNE